MEWSTGPGNAISSEFYFGYNVQLMSAGVRAEGLAMGMGVNCRQKVKGLPELPKNIA